MWNTHVACDGSAVGMWYHFLPRFHELTLSCLSVVWSVVKMTLEMNLYELRVLFCNCMLVTNCTKGKLLRFWCKNILNGKKCISSWNFHTSQVGNSFNWEMYVNRCRQFWFSIILSSWVIKFLKWVLLYIIIYLKSVASSVFSRGVFKSFIIKWKHHSIL